MRKRPTIEPPQALTDRDLDLIEQVREYRLITPLYGGGVTPGEADPVTTIRATEIRGHLRFWWRATRGGQFGNDRKAMKSKEDEIWGKAYKKGDPIVSQDTMIQILVESLKQSTNNDDREPFKVMRNSYGQNQSRYDHATGIPAYAVEVQLE